MRVTASRRRAERRAAEAKQRTDPTSSPAVAQNTSSGSPLTISKAIFSGRALWVSLALIAANVAIYSSVWNFGFIQIDDPLYMTDNGHVPHGLTWDGVLWALTTGFAANWHPLTWLSHMLDVQMYGMHGGPHHLTNLLLHIVNTLLLFGLLHSMTRAMGRSAFVAALFAVHPLHVESVAWIAERKDVLSTLFWMLTLWGYVEYVRRPRLGRYLVVLLLFALGLMAKPMLVTLPFVLLLLDFWPLERVSLGAFLPRRPGSGPARDRRKVLLLLVREKLPLFVLSAASSIITIVVQQRAGAIRPLDALPFSIRMANTAVAYVTYIGKMLWPARLAVFYPFPPVILVWWIVGSILVLIGVSVVAIWAARRYPYLPVGWLWFLGTLVPVIGLVQVGGQSMADRYTYVPLIGLFVIVAWWVPDLLARWPYRRIALPAAAGIVILACMISAWSQVQYWGNDMALLEHALEATTDNYGAHNNLGASLAQQGRIDEAIAHYSEAIRIMPDFALSHDNLGILLGKQGRFDEAIAHFSRAVQLNPNYAEAHNNLGSALGKQGRMDEAIHEFSEALRIVPDFAEAHANLGSALVAKGKYKEALGEFLEALRIAPNRADFHYDAGVTLDKMGQPAEAAAHFKRALELNPGLEEARRALDNLTRRSAAASGVSQ